MCKINFPNIVLVGVSHMLHGCKHYYSGRLQKNVVTVSNLANANLPGASLSNYLRNLSQSHANSTLNSDLLS